MKKLLLNALSVILLAFAFFSFQAEENSFVFCASLLLASILVGIICYAISFYLHKMKYINEPLLLEHSLGIDFISFVPIVILFIVMYFFLSKEYFSMVVALIGVLIINLLKLGNTYKRRILRLFLFFRKIRNKEINNKYVAKRMLFIILPIKYD